MKRSRIKVIKLDAAARRRRQILERIELLRDFIRQGKTLIEFAERQAAELLETMKADGL